MTMIPYEMLTAPKEVYDAGIVRLSHLRWGNQIWCKGKIRKEHRFNCAVSRIRLKKGDEAFHPITNKGNRGERISILEIQKMMQCKVDAEANLQHAVQASGLSKH